MSNVLCFTAISSKKRVSRVSWTARVEKALRLSPPAIVKKFRYWATLVEEVGIREVRMIKGFHDEPLSGNRRGQRSIRLNRSYRAIYLERTEASLELLEVIEVNKHEY